MKFRRLSDTFWAKRVIIGHRKHAYAFDFMIDRKPKTYKRERIALFWLGHLK